MSLYKYYDSNKEQSNVTMCSSDMCVVIWKLKLGASHLYIYHVNSMRLCISYIRLNIKCW